jgi:hypothetical protein
MTQTLAQLVLPTETWNGALSLAGTGSALLDYFAKAGTYRDRAQAEVDADMDKIFAEDERLALAVVFGVRLISRKPNVPGIDDAQTGYGQRDEFAKALVWLHAHRPDDLYRNLHLLPVFGCWRDLLNEPLLNTLDREAVFALVRDNLDNALLRKYLPTIRSGSKVRSDRDRARSQWAKDLCRFLGLREQDYRKLKAEGPAHVFQRQMSRNQWDTLNFNGIPGRAMTRLVSRTGKDKKTPLERHGQVERLLAWVREQPTVKFTGYAYELVRAARTRKDLVSREIFDRQFATVLEPMRGHKLGNVLCALDTSGSMTMEVVPGVSAYDICISLGIAFSSLNLGHFRDCVVAFSQESNLVTLRGSFTERLRQIETMTTAWGSTNFQSVIDLLVRIRRDNPAIPVAEYPSTLLVVSDMQFNPVEGNAQTNYQAALQKLRAVGLGEMRIIWWFVNGAAKDFPAAMDDEGVYLVGGFDPAVLKGLMGLKGNESSGQAKTPEKRKETPLEGMLNFLRQPIFGLLSVSG